MARILIADDDREMRRLLEHALARAGHEIDEASNGQQLLALVHEAATNGHRPDVIVSDIRMPGCSGLHALAETRRLLPQTPVILITAFGDAQTHERAAQLGAVEVFDKPFDLGALLARVNALIERQQR